MAHASIYFLLEQTYPPLIPSTNHVPIIMPGGRRNGQPIEFMNSETIKQFCASNPGEPVFYRWRRRPPPLERTSGEARAMPPSRTKSRPNVWMHRGGNQGYLQMRFSDAGSLHSSSPQGYRRWADRDHGQLCSLSLYGLEYLGQCFMAARRNTVGVNAVLHLKTDDIYIDITFTSWSVGSGYSYVRSTPSPATSAAQRHIVFPYQRSHFHRASECSNHAPTQAILTVVSRMWHSSNGATFLGGTNNTPYTLLPLLETGSHALTAVATE